MLPDLQQGMQVMDGSACVRAPVQHQDIVICGLYCNRYQVCNIKRQNQCRMVGQVDWEIEAKNATS